MRWAMHVACMAGIKYAYSLVGKAEGNTLLGKNMHRWGIILQYIFEKWDGRIWTGFIWFLIGQVASSCELDNEHLGSIK
jgi:hypothetical protein